MCNLLKKANVSFVPVRKQLLVRCSLMDSGNDVYFTHDGVSYAILTHTREEIETYRKGGKFEMDVEVTLPFHWNAKS